VRETLDIMYIVWCRRAQDNRTVIVNETQNGCYW